jgi:hypothetical protein
MKLNSFVGDSRQCDQAETDSDTQGFDDLLVREKIQDPRFHGPSAHLCVQVLDERRRSLRSLPRFSVTRSRRSEIARKAAETRWAKSKKDMAPKDGIADIERNGVIMTHHQ